MNAKRSLIFITGANRGFGQSIAVVFAKYFTNAVFMLTSRNIDNLKSTIDQIKTINPNIIVYPLVFDQSDINEADQLTHFKSCILGEKFDIFMVIHNAGSIGDVSKYAHNFDGVTIDDFFKTNVTGAIKINSLFLQSIDESLTKNTCSIIVNISSLAAVKPFPSWSLYCASKAAREMYFNCLSEEWKKHHPEIKNGRFYVINYAPGPLETDMMSYLLENTVDNEVKCGMNNMVKDKGLLKPSESADKLLRKLIIPRVSSTEEIQDFERCDYFDL